MPNWKNIVSKSNSRQYRWPVGWQTREQVAEDLECSRDRVAEILAPAIEQGIVERKSFPVWDASTNRRIMVTGYREIKNSEKMAKPTAEKNFSFELKEGTKIVRRDGNGAVGILAKEGNKWRVDWSHREPTYPSMETIKKRMQIVG